MTDKTYYILRHGETFATKTRSSYGDQIESSPILEEGIKVIERIADYLKDIPTDFNVSSPYIRCKQTVLIIESRTDKIFNYDDRLGEFYNKTFDQFKVIVLNLIKELEGSKYETILICTHGSVISAFLNYLLYHHINAEDLPNYPSPGELLIIKNNKSSLLDFN